MENTIRMRAGDPAWKEAGFRSIGESLPWAMGGFTADVAWAWHSRNFSVVDAASWGGAGFTDAAEAEDWYIGGNGTVDPALAAQMRARGLKPGEAWQAYNRLIEMAADPVTYGFGLENRLARAAMEVIAGRVTTA